MEESTPHSSSWSRSVLVLSPVALLVKGGQYGELVLPSLPPPDWRRREGEELVCGTASALTDRWDMPTQAVSEWSEGGEEQGGGGAGRGSTVCPSRWKRVSALSLTWKWTQKWSQRQWQYKRLETCELAVMCGLHRLVHAALV